MKAYELLNSPEKWTQGEYANEGRNRFCIYGAIIECYPDEASCNQAKMKIFDILYEADAGTPIRWNDAPERTFEEVRALLIEADV